MEEHIRESNLIEGIDDPAEDEQSLFAWEWLQQWGFPINSGIIMKLQKRIVLNQPLLPNQKGYFRGVAGNDVNVRVGRHVPPGYQLVPALMENWCLDMKKWRRLDPKAMHIRFEDIHPFVDGNGRTGRMLMWLHEIKLGLEPTLIRSNEVDRFQYYQWFK